MAARLRENRIDRGPDLLQPQVWALSSVCFDSDAAGILTLILKAAPAPDKVSPEMTK